MSLSLSTLVLTNEANADEAPFRGEIRTRDGVVLATSTSKAGDTTLPRLYPKSKAFAHIVGHISKKDSEFKGVTGLERTFNDSLSKGKHLTLTIDSKLQLAAYTILEQSGFSGAIVVSDPNTGGLLVLASNPSFDPNLFIPTIGMGDFQRLSKNNDKPLFNRCTGVYPPGDTAKLITALAAQHAGLGDPEYHCTGSLQVGSRTIRDWDRDRDERLTISSALKGGCNTYFMQLAIDTGGSKMLEMGDLLNIGNKNLTDIENRKGTWLVEFGEHYRARVFGADYDFKIDDATLAFASTGHGSVSMTPVDVNSVTSAIANGTWRKPHLVSNPENAKLDIVLKDVGEITEQSLDIIRQGLISCVNQEGGAVPKARIDAHTVAGIAATVGYGRGISSCTWFTCYAPAEKPRYAVTVFLENGTNGAEDAAPLAAKFLKSALK